MADLPDEDVALLRTLGTSTIRSFVCCLVSTWVVGLYTWLVVNCGLILLHKDRRKNRISLFTWTIVLTMYLIKLTLWTIDARNVISDLNIVLVQRNDQTLAEKQLRADETATKLASVEDVLYAFQVVLGDTIVLWRVYAFWHTGLEMWAMILPCAAYLGSITCAFLVTYCAAQPTDLEFGAFTNPYFCRSIQHTSYWLQFITALIATILIGFKTWKYRRMVKTLIGNETTWRSPVSNAMLIMLDTGLIYAIFFLAEAILGSVDIPKWVTGHPARGFALQIYQYQTSSIVGIYPTIVVLLVHSHTQSFLLDSSGHQTISTLHFETNRTGRSALPQHHHHHHSSSHRLSHPQFISARGTGWTSHSQDPSDTEVGSGDVRSRKSGKLNSSLSQGDSESGYALGAGGFVVSSGRGVGGDIEDALENPISLQELGPAKRASLTTGFDEEEEEEEDRSVKKVPIDERVVSGADEEV